MEVRIESMVCLWDDTNPKMFLEFVNLLTLATSEEVHKFNEHRGDFIVPQTNHAFNSYFHTIGYYRLILCRFHPLADKVHVAVHKVYNAVVVLGIGIVQATTLHHFQCLQGNLHRFYALAVNGCG